MKLVTPPLIVEKNDAFKNDALDRKIYGEALLNIISRSSDALVVSLDGKWGEGKTTFVKMWQGLLSEKNIHNIYIDAFANDYVDDAFITVASAITNYAEEHIVKDHQEEISELKDKAKWAEKSAACSSLCFLLPVITDVQAVEKLDMRNFSIIFRAESRLELNWPEANRPEIHVGACFYGQYLVLIYGLGFPTASLAKNIK